MVSRWDFLLLLYTICPFLLVYLSAHQLFLVSARQRLGCAELLPPRGTIR